MGHIREFHFEWMERAPGNEVRYALDRRKQFPVAVVVMAHDGIPIMRPSLEGVALVVEHIVSYYIAHTSVRLCSSIDLASPSVHLDRLIVRSELVFASALTLRVVVATQCARTAAGCMRLRHQLVAKTIFLTEYLASCMISALCAVYQRRNYAQNMGITGDVSAAISAYRVLKKRSRSRLTSFWPPFLSSSQLVVVSTRMWNGDDKDVSNVLDVLNAMLEDTSSPTYGKVGDVHVHGSNLGRSAKLKL